MDVRWLLIPALLSVIAERVVYRRLALRRIVYARRLVLPDPFLRAGSRAYTPGDPLNQVNWKATARSGSFQVHQQEYTADYRIHVILNLLAAEISAQPHNTDYIVMIRSGARRTAVAALAGFANVVLFLPLFIAAATFVHWHTLETVVLPLLLAAVIGTVVWLVIRALLPA